MAYTIYTVRRFAFFVLFLSLQEFFREHTFLRFPRFSQSQFSPILTPNYPQTMKKSGFFAASVAAASATAISASSFSSSFSCNTNFKPSTEVKKNEENSGTKRSVSTEKFAPRFDGLRFIETLVTAHR